MKTEKVILSFIAIIIGLLVTGIIFFLYQTTKIVPPNKIKNIVLLNPTPPPQSSLFLILDSPRDEEVVDKKIVTVSGKTQPDATVVISTNNTDDVITPASNGAFSSSITINDGQNQIEVVAIAPNGQEAHITKTITFSTETF
ncbi:MAG: hypothetical protein A3F31_05565 [Candidatus Levybacteria bacterium RIFCSPHIGHO2_12_FULL_38_12]|nr:MAG: hypothetical protein A2770_00050 [Candidatus Levybacteria bacterium RIFCSPHIGHO2_01_FULL_38_12]OGH23085.1 MAG: hypothetical protein A3F31_05565 [Candidatus Levybacteria bacterium RIFCSPHIGHO2_12_FULL_38_12]OGH33803.1 MAG: hypothetical protein A3A47_02025 [Candidatus Levybacteria bacterium RIFCSPLOWO2_01_FULL_37_20]OGH44778.1 MAG: hypothetical protein A3J14_02285 [Candidatus Levybacteria bacterium RIFCSPLOWO2_02_FULL_37_18]